MKIGWSIQGEVRTSVVLLSKKEAYILREVIAVLKPSVIQTDIEEDGIEISKEDIQALLDCLYKGLK